MQRFPGSRDAAHEAEAQLRNPWHGMPDYDALLIEEPEPTAPFNAKSIGEVVFPPVAPAVVEAVNDALGTELTHLPLTPAVILEALEV